MSNAPDVIILAAGKGTRMHSVQPKVMHQIAGKPMLQYVLETAADLDATTISVVYGHGGEHVPQAFAGWDVRWVRQDEQLGTGHAALQALPHIGGDGVTLVLYGDVPLLQVETLRRLVTLSQGDRLAILTLMLDEPAGYGRIVRNDNGNIACIVEEKDATDDQKRIREINTGVMAIPSAALRRWLPALENRNRQAEYYLTDIVRLAAAEGVGIVSLQPDDENEVLGINDRRQLAQAERAVQQRTANRLLLEGVTLLDPARTDVRGQLTCGYDVSIDIGCVFLGQVELGDRVQVGPYCVLKDVVVRDDTVIAAFSHLDGAEIGENTRIGPFARLRPGTRLAAGVHIGNFVEIKNSQVEYDSKINHLSYVGDSVVGHTVNIGAGTITVNYDGVNKNRTIIGNDVFVGSGSELIAPLTIGDGATIAAGSTITHDAPAGKLTIARERQVTHPTWTRPQRKAK